MRKTDVPGFLSHPTSRIMRLGALMAGLIALAPAITAGLPPNWRFVTSLPQGNHLLAAWATTPNDLHVGGHGGIIMHWDGKAWTQMSTPSQKSVYSIHGLSGSDLWAVGGDDSLVMTNRSLILHYDGVKWTEVPPPNFSGTAPPLNAVHAVAPDDVWATTNSGTWPVHWDGKSWQFVQVPLLMEGSLKAITSIGPDHLFFGGTHGQIVHRDKGNWILEQRSKTGVSRRTSCRCSGRRTSSMSSWVATGATSIAATATARG